MGHKARDYRKNRPIKDMGVQTHFIDKGLLAR